MARWTNNDCRLHDTLRLRGISRAFADRYGEASELRSRFEAARQAPSSYKAQPGAFLVRWASGKPKLAMR